MSSEMIKNLRVYLFLLCLIVATQPFYLWNYRGAMTAVTGLGFLSIGLTRWPRNSIRRMSFSLFFIFYFYASLNAFQTTIYGVIFTFLPLILFLINDKDWKHIYKLFVLFYSITLIPSLVVYFMVIWGDINLPSTEIPPLNEYKDYTYLKYPFLVVSNVISGQMRFCGYYDEPGVIGTFSSVFLIVNKISLKDWKNWLLLISGIFSFSLFFYAILFIYLLIFGSIKSKVLVCVVLFIGLSFFIMDDNPFSKLILSRLEYDSSDGWSGDNRTGAKFEKFWDKFIASSMFWVGYGKNYSLFVADTGGASYKHLIVDHGIISFLLYFIAFSLYYYSYKLSRKHFILLIMLLAMNIFQRPFIFSLSYLFLFLAPASVLKDYELSKRII